MKYKVDVKSEKPAYLQLYEIIRNDIVSGAYAYKGKLPSKRIMAEEAGVSVITVTHAYSLLCDEGYIDTKERSGYFVVYKHADFISDADFLGEKKIGVIPSPGVNTVFPFSVIARTMRKVLADYGDAIFVKPQAKGSPELRQSLSAYLKRTVGIDASPDRIIVGAGAEYLYSLIVQLLGKDKIYALENPSYKKIRRVYEAHGARCEMLEMGENGIRTEALKAARATVLHITPFNSYPSLITASAPKRYEYIRWAKERGGFIVEDNYDSELTVSKKNEDTVFSTCGGEEVIYVNTFSQTISPSVRIGYMVLPESLSAMFEEKLGFYSCTVPVFEQYVLAELINSGEFERHINRVRREKRKLLK